MAGSADAVERSVGVFAAQKIFTTRAAPQFSKRRNHYESMVSTVAAGGSYQSACIRERTYVRGSVKTSRRKRGKCSADAKRNYREYSRTSIRLGKLRRFCVWGCDRTKNTI